MAKLRVDKIAAPIVKDEFTGSVHFDGTTQNRITIPSTTDFAPGTGDFTIEMWVYHTNLTGQQTYFGDTYGNTSGIYTYKTSNNEISLYDSAQRSLSAQNVIKLNTWHHIAWTRESGVLRAFVDGVIVDEDTYTGNFTDTDYFIGDTAGTSSGEMVGYISNLRYCKLHAVYTSNFTVPTRELEVHTGAKGVVFPTADNRTTLLACQSSTDATADATGRHILTASSGVTAADANPGLLRKTNITSTITENTGSVFFDGNADHLKLANSTDFNYGSGDFSIEVWVYLLSSAGGADNHGIASNYITSGNRRSWLLMLSGATPAFLASSDGTSGNLITVSSSVDVADETWTHIAVSRTGTTLTIYVNGVQQAQNSSFHSSIYSNTDDPVEIGGYNNGTNTFEGYISNLRICKGHQVYKSNFIPPIRELEVHEGPDDDRTVLLACYDGENIFADKTGRHIIAAYGDRLSSPTPTATDSPIGITTNYPPVTRNVDPVEGPTFGGGAGFVSQNWLTLPKGTTTERMPSFGGVTVGTRGIFAGAYSPSRSDVINYVTVPTLGNAIDFGNLGGANGGVAGFSDSTRGWIAGGNILPAGRVNVMEYVTIASSGNAVDGGDLITATQVKPGSVANSIRGIVAGGSTPGQVKTIVHHTIQTTGIAQNFGDLTEAKNQLAGLMSPTRGVFAGGNTPSGKVDTIEYVTIASSGNAVLFGELSLDDRCQMGGASNTVRGLFGGGRNPSDFTHIEYITMATLGNAQDFGDLTQTGMDGDVGAVSNSTRVVFGGGSSDELGYVEIATLGNTTEFGKFTVQTTANQDPGCFSNGHGGLG
jgi:hypothetical protein